jgi:hypothetical protein
MNIKNMLPFLDEEEIDRLALKIAASSSGEFQGTTLKEVLPFASEEGIDKAMIRAAQNGKDVSGCFPFASEEGLGDLVRLAVSGEIQNVSLKSILPFVDDDTLKSLAQKVIASNGDFQGLTLASLFPFMDDEDVDRAFISEVEKGDPSASTLAPFASEDAFHYLVKEYLSGKLEHFDLDAFYPFMDEDDLKTLFNKVIDDSDV